MVATVVPRGFQLGVPQAVTRAQEDAAVCTISHRRGLVQRPDLDWLAQGFASARSFGNQPIGGVGIVEFEDLLRREAAQAPFSLVSERALPAAAVVPADVGVPCQGHFGRERCQDPVGFRNSVTRLARAAVLFCRHSVGTACELAACGLVPAARHHTGTSSNVGACCAQRRSPQQTSVGLMD